MALPRGLTLFFRLNRLQFHDPDVSLVCFSAWEEVGPDWARLQVGRPGFEPDRVHLWPQSPCIQILSNTCGIGLIQIKCVVPFISEAFDGRKSCFKHRQQAPPSLSFARPEQRLRLRLGGSGVASKLHL